MTLFNLTRSFVLAAGLLLSSLPVVAQVAETEQERVKAMAAQLTEVMASLEARAEGYPKFIADLQAGLVTIEQADEQVAALIQQLTEATDKMEDSSELDNSIDEYRVATTTLIAQAEASSSDAIKSAIPGLQLTIDDLNKSDETRATTVIEARNLIRSLEQNREAIAFFIKADQVQRGADLIAANVAEFSQIVQNGKSLAAGLTGAANP